MSCEHNCGCCGSRPKIYAIYSSLNTLFNTWKVYRVHTPIDTRFKTQKIVVHTRFNTRNIAVHTLFHTQIKKCCVELWSLDPSIKSKVVPSGNILWKPLVPSDSMRRRVALLVEASRRFSSQLIPTNWRVETPIGMFFHYTYCVSGGGSFWTAPLKLSSWMKDSLLSGESSGIIGTPRTTGFSTPSEIQ